MRGVCRRRASIARRSSALGSHRSTMTCGAPLATLKRVPSCSISASARFATGSKGWKRCDSVRRRGLTGGRASEDRSVDRVGRIAPRRQRCGQQQLVACDTRPPAAARRASARSWSGCRSCRCISMSMPGHLFDRDETGDDSLAFAQAARRRPPSSPIAPPAAPPGSTATARISANCTVSSNGSWRNRRGHHDDQRRGRWSSGSGNCRCAAPRAGNARRSSPAATRRAVLPK